ncbi:MAG: right-handed parallel beta-helix repeat-containing protein, partial [bacterium]
MGQSIGKGFINKAISCTTSYIWILLIILIMTTYGTFSEARDIYVGQAEEFSIIQGAIDVAVDGDVVIVKDGTYKGIGNKKISFKGKAITVKSENGSQNCIIDCEQDGRGFLFQNNETSRSFLDGFTIINGKSTETLYGMTIGGVIYCYSSSPTIINCIMKNNNADIGGGIYCHLASPMIENCDISENNANFYGGGIYCYSSSSPTIDNCTLMNNSAINYYGGAIFCDSSSSPKINNCIISDNNANYGGAGVHCESSSVLKITNCIIVRNKGKSGGGIYCESSSVPEIVNCVIAGNRAENGDGGGIYCASSSSPKISNCTFNINYAKSNAGGIFCSNSSPVIKNCILWDDTPNEIYGAPSNANVTYSDIKGGYSGTKNINADPLFFDPGNGDYRLRSGSPCIDVGDGIDKLYSDLRGSLRPIDANEKNEGNNFDMGAFEYSNYNNDLIIKAFQEVKLIGYYGLTNYDNEVGWISTHEFPKNDNRIFISEGNFNFYRIRLALIKKNGRRINIKEENISTSYPENLIQAEGLHVWSRLFRFNQEHLGNWYLRIEMADDPHQYLESDTPIEIKQSETHSWIIGQSISPPEYADPNKKPDIPEQAQSSFYWSDYAKKLYAVSPVTAIIKWKNPDDIPIPVIGKNIWPDQPQIHIAESPPVDLTPSESGYRIVEKRFENCDSFINTHDEFTATVEGYSVLAYWEIDQDNSEPVFEVVRTRYWDDPNILVKTAWLIGKELSDSGHNTSCGDGYVFFLMARYDYKIYDREIHSGQIFPVNKDNLTDPNDEMVVVWYQKGITNVCWPGKPVHYNCQWPQDAEKIIIARQNGSGVINEAIHGTDWEIYIQNDANQPGFNPNDEHAKIFQYSNGRAIFALRDDLGSELTSEPYVLMKYKESATHLWGYRVFKVMREEVPYLFSDWAHLSNDPDDPAYDPNTRHDPPSDPYEGKAGVLIQPPFPLTAMKYCEENAAVSGPYFEDRKERHWAKSAGDDGGPVNIIMRYYYIMQTGFYPDEAHGGPPVGAHIPWLDAGTGIPVDVTYTITWPKEVPQMKIGSTLVSTKYGLPAIDKQCSVDIIYQQSIANGGGSSVIFVDPINIRMVDLSKIPDDIIKEYHGDAVTFPQLSLALRRRISYEPDPNDSEKGYLKFKGEYIQPVTGFDYVLLNVMSKNERDELLELSLDPLWQSAVNALYAATKDPVQVNDCNVDPYEMLALTSGFAQGTGYVTLAMQNAGVEKCTEDSPISLEIIQVTADLDKGGLMVITPQCPFDEKLTLRYKLDFAGRPEDYEFHWKSVADNEGIPPSEDPDDWDDYLIKKGAVDITIKGPGLFTLSDNWFICRYRYTGGDMPWDGQWSDWTDPQLAVGWIKRVVGEINPFTQRATGGGIEGAENSFFSYKD